MRNEKKKFRKWKAALSFVLALALLLSNATLLYSMPTAEGSETEESADIQELESGDLISEEEGAPVEENLEGGDSEETDITGDPQPGEDDTEGTESEGDVTDDTESEDDVTEEGGEEEELPQALSYEDEQVLVSLYAEDGVIPEGVSLSVRPITKEENAEEYQDVADQLEAQAQEEEKEIQGFLAYDISLVDEEGNEVEPDGQVEVTIDYKEAVIPEEVDTEAADEMDITVMHLEEDADGNVQKVADVGAQEQIKTLETTESQEVQKVVFTAESFSVYTLIWNNVAKQVFIHYGYMDGNTFTEFTELSNRTISGLQSGSKKNPRWINLNDSDYQPDVSGYTPLEVRKGEATGSKITHIRRYDSAFWTRNGNSGNGNEWSANTYNLYYIYEKVDELTTVETVDSTSAGITMRMTNYEKAADGLDGNIGGGYGDGNVKQGLLNKVLTNGYPRTKGGTSLAKLFNDGTEVNHLFLQSTYDATGYYEYSSFDNYAYLGNGSNFTVYEQIGTPENSSQYYFKRGNFMPYNRIEAGKFSTNTNRYDENGNELSPDHPRYGEKLYKTQGTNDFYFGMYMEANFLQMKDGQVTHKGTTSDMIYEFNGDDDLWVFIDDVLVLDIGGIHDAHSGYINFATGDVHVELSKGNSVDTNIKDMFNAAIPDRGSITLSNGTVLTKSNINNYFDGNTFKDYSAHNMKMFYMERGKGASNLHMKFNLPTIPEGQVEIQKELSNTDKEKYANVDFNFKLYAQKITSTSNDGTEKYDEPDTYVPVGNKAYVLLNSSNEEIGSGTTDEDGSFSLKPGQKARFNLQANRKYYAAETGVHSDEYYEVTINDTIIELGNEDGETEATIKDVESPKAAVSDRPLLTFINSCTTKNQRELRITKEIDGDLISPDTFSFKIKLENTNGDLVPYVGDYYLQDSEGNYYYYDNEGQLTSNGKEGKVCGQTGADGIVRDIRDGYTVSITKILSDTDFLVEEVDINQERFKTSYKKVLKDGSYGKASVNGADGQILLGKDAEMTITNYPYQSITAEKSWSDGQGNHGSDSVYIGLYQVNGDTLTPVEGKTAVLSANGWEHTWEQLEPGNYTVRELRPVQDGETTEFTIGVTGYIRVEEGGMLTVSGSDYKAEYGDLTAASENNTMDSSMTITNTKVSKLPVEKIWSDNDKTVDHNSITVGLFDPSDNFVGGSIQELNQANEWKYTYGIEADSAKGYTVKELVEITNEQSGCIEANGKYYLAVENNEMLQVNGQIYEATYGTKNGGITITNTLQLGSIEITKKNSGGDVLEGAKFELTDKKGVKVGEATTGEDGIIKFENLLPGEYTVTEVKSPENYTLLANPVKVTVGTTEGDSTTDSGLTVVGDKDTHYYHIKLEVINHKLFTMPEAGGGGLVKGMMFAGAFLMLAAGGWGYTLYIRRKRVKISKK